MKKRKIICIVGPTASGKTALGVELAKKFNGEIISADSRQVYRGLDIGTGKDLEEYGSTKYHLIDICDPGEKFTMFDWLTLARETIEDIFARGKTPIVVGGTGLYVQALLEGFEQANQKSKIKNQNYNLKIKEYSREELDQKTLEELQEICRRLPTADCQLDFNNPRRLIRAIERAQEGTIITRRKPDFDGLQIGITLPREKLYEKIDQRTDQQFTDGMIEEVENLIKSGVDPQWLINLGLEYKIICQFILDCHPERIRRPAEKPKDLKNKDFSTTLETTDKSIFQTQNFQEMTQELKYKVHAFARRQLTWFRRFPEIKWIENSKEAEKIAQEFLQSR